MGRIARAAASGEVRLVYAHTLPEANASGRILVATAASGQWHPSARALG